MWETVVGFPSEVFFHRPASCDIDAKRDGECECVGSYESLRGDEFYYETPVDALLSLPRDSYERETFANAYRWLHLDEANQTAFN